MNLLREAGCRQGWRDSPMYDASGNSFSAPRCKGNEPQRWSMRRRMQQRAARPCGAAAPRNGDAHGARLRSEGSPRSSRAPLDQGSKAAKFAVLTPGRAGFPNRAKRSEGSDSAPTRNAPVSPCEPLRAILLAKASVYPLSSAKANVGRLCECDLKPLWKGLSPCRMGRTFSVFRTDQAVIGGKQGSRRSPAKRVRWEEETQRNE